MEKKRNIVLVNPPLPYKADPLAALGLEALKSTLNQEGYSNVHILDSAIEGINDVDSIISKIRQLAADLDFLGIGMLPAVAQFTKQLINRARQEYKDRAIEICIGGYFPTSYGEQTFDFLDPNFPDYVVLGRGEQALLDILEVGKSAKIPNVITHTEAGILNGDRAPVDLSQTPWPERNGINSDNTAKVTRLIGCPGHCTFCTVHNYAYDNKSQEVKQRTPEDFVNELEYLFHESGIENFDILDDDAIGDNPEQWHRILDLIEEKGLKGKIKFWILTRIEGVVNNHALIKRMAESGLTGCYLGLESLIKRQLKLYNKMNSRLSQADYFTFFAQVRKSREILEENSIIPKYGFIPIDAEVTLEELKLNILLLKELGLLYYVSELTKRVAIYEGSGIQKQYRKKGYLYEPKERTDEDWIVQRYNYISKDPRIIKLQPLLNQWMKGIYQTSIDVKSLNRERYIDPDSEKSNKAWQLYKNLRDVELEMLEELMRLVGKNAPEDVIKEKLKFYIDKYNSIFKKIVL
ncbi:B12-binding domain-containing radical SAM protein [Patescibacteria group bacterium]